MTVFGYGREQSGYGAGMMNPGMFGMQNYGMQGKNQFNNGYQPFNPMNPLTPRGANFGNGSYSPRIPAQQMDLNQIVEGLMLGSRFALHPQCLEAHSIKHVINCSYELHLHEMIDWKELNSLGVQVMHMDWDDATNQVIAPSPKLYEAITWIDNLIASGNTVLVNCSMGRSRSTSLVIAFLMARHSHSYDSALQLVQSKRPVAQPNTGFAQQLQAWGQQLRADDQQRSNVNQYQSNATVTQSALTHNGNAYGAINNNTVVNNPVTPVSSGHAYAHNNSHTNHNLTHNLNHGHYHGHQHNQHNQNQHQQHQHQHQHSHQPHPYNHSPTHHQSHGATYTNPNLNYNAGATYTNPMFSKGATVTNANLAHGAGATYTNPNLGHGAGATYTNPNLMNGATITNSMLRGATVTNPNLNGYGSNAYGSNNNNGGSAYGRGATVTNPNLTNGFGYSYGNGGTIGNHWAQQAQQQQMQWGYPNMFQGLAQMQQQQPQQSHGHGHSHHGHHGHQQQQHQQQQQMPFGYGGPPQWPSAMGLAQQSGPQFQRRKSAPAWMGNGMEMRAR